MLTLKQLTADDIKLLHQKHLRQIKIQLDLDDIKDDSLMIGRLLLTENATLTKTILKQSGKKVILGKVSNAILAHHPQVTKPEYITIPIDYHFYSNESKCKGGHWMPAIIRIKINWQDLDPAILGGDADEEMLSKFLESNIDLFEMRLADSGRNKEKNKEELEIFSNIMYQEFFQEKTSENCQYRDMYKQLGNLCGDFTVIGSLTLALMDQGTLINNCFQSSYKVRTNTEALLKNKAHEQLLNWKELLPNILPEYEVPGQKDSLDEKASLFIKHLEGLTVSDEKQSVSEQLIEFLEYQQSNSLLNGACLSESVAFFKAVIASASSSPSKIFKGYALFAKKYKESHDSRIKQLNDLDSYFNGIHAMEFGEKTNQFMVNLSEQRGPKL